MGLNTADTEVASQVLDGIASPALPPQGLGGARRFAASRSPRVWQSPCTLWAASVISP
jgi:hypothetical protein